MNRLISYLTLITLAMPIGAVEVSRSKLDHPALGTVGGSSLHTALENIYITIGDNANSRYQEYSAIADSATVELDHNFGVNLDQLNVLIYSGTGANLTRITDPESQSPPWTIQEKTGSEKIIIEIIAPSSGGPHTFTVVAIHGKGSEKLDDLSDVDVTTVIPAIGETIVWDGTNFVPGASGDASFKIESVADPNVLIKGGKYGLTNRRQLASYDGVGSTAADFQGDLDCNLTTILGGAPADNTTYNVFIDLNLVGNTPITTTDSGERFYPVECSDIVLLTSFPEASLGSRYVPVGFIHTADTGTAWSGTGAALGTFAFRIHDQTYVTVSPVIYSLEQAVGSIGSSGQIAGGHSLIANSFTSNPAGLSWWTLDDDLNDDSANGRNLTPENGAAVNGIGLFGAANTALDCNGSNQQVNSSDATLIAGATSFTAFAWAQPDVITSGRIMANSSGAPAAEPNGFGWGIQLSSGNILFNLSEDGTDLDFRLNIGNFFSVSEWVHVAVVYDQTNQIMKIYKNGVLAGTQSTSGLTLAAGPAFRICSDGPDFFDGRVEQAGYENRAYSSEEIRKLASYRIDHNKNVALADQNWISTFSGNLSNQLENGWIVDKTTDSLWFDFLDLASTDNVSIKLKNENATAHVLPVNTFDTGFLSTAPSFPLSHGLGSVPAQVVVIHEGQTTSGDYDDVSNLCSWNDSQITCAGLNTIDGTHRLRIVMSVSTVAVAVAPATATESGIVTTQTQSFAGDKTFVNNVTVSGDAYVLQELGIGTTAPSKELETVGTLNGAGPVIRLKRNDTSYGAEEHGSIEFATTELSVSEGTGRVARIAARSDSGSGGTGILTFEVNATGSALSEAMRIQQNGKAELSVREDGNCGIGTVCSGEFTPTFSSNVNCSGGFGLTHLRSWFKRVGKNVEVTTIMNCDPDNISTLTSFIIDEASLPFSPNLVAASNNCAGNGTHEDSGSPGVYAPVQINSSDAGCAVEWVTINNSNARMVLKYSYIIE